MRRIHRHHIISLAGVGAVLAVCLIYLFGSVLRTPLGASATTLEVDLPRTGGLYAGSGVTHRGVVVGKVTDLRLTEDGVRATVRLAPNTAIPSSSRVQVRSLSPIGEQYLDFQPTGSAGGTLQDGDRVTGTAADVPRTVADLATSLDKLMGQVDATQVRLVLGELSTSLGGAEEDLQSLLGDTASLVETFDDNAGLLSRFARESRTTLAIGADARGEIVSATRDLATFTSWLKDYQPELYSTLERAPGQIAELRALVADLVEVMPDLLDAQGDLSSILHARNPQIRALLQDFPAGVNAFSGAIRDRYLQVDLLLRRGPYCDYDTAERDPRDVSFRALQDKGRCSTGLTGYSQRGAQFAPGGLW